MAMNPSTYILAPPHVRSFALPVLLSLHTSVTGASILVALLLASPAGLPSPLPILVPSEKQPFVTEYRLVLWSFPSFLVHPASPLIMSPRSGKRGLEVKSLILLENSLVGLDFNFFLVPPVIQTAPTQLGLTCAEYPLCF